ncbi:MAG TPA: SDR family NAD(P)-dependent oxidoreductase [Chloroflexota bacterium]|nr:SDR family NAD(P)-dependent oxidoreductase [Chloroflexota bacterium]
MRLAGKKALVTGAAQGLGQHMALALAEEGCDIAAFDVRAEQLAAVCATIRGKGRRTVGLDVDVRDYGAVQDAVTRVYEEWGSLDILVNNAGKGQRQGFTEVTPELWHYTLDVNLTSVFNLCQAVVPQMIEQKSGRIINISSIAALRGGRMLGKTAYAAAKGGVIGFTKSLAMELAPYKVTVNCIAPGIQNTPRRAQDTPGEQELIMSQVPMKELGEPSDLAQTVVFLCLPTSRYITGIVLPQDGGHSI